MEKISVVLAKAHADQIKDLSVKRELESVQAYLDETPLALSDHTVYLMCLRGYYDNFSKSMNTAFLFINHTGKAIRELHGVIRLRCRDRKGVQFAKATIDFDGPFLGVLRNQEALLAHLSIPARGLDADITFTDQELEVEFTDTRVTYVDESEDENE